MILKIKKGEYDKMFTNELKDLLAGLYQKYGCTQEVLQLSNIIDEIIVKEQRERLKEYYKSKKIISNFKVIKHINIINSKLWKTIELWVLQLILRALILGFC